MGQDETHIWQTQIEWFDQGSPGPSADERRHWCDLRNPDNPFSTLVGNEHAVRRLCRAAFEVFGRYNRCCSDHHLALIGPPSCGKATLARSFGKLTCLPFVEIQGQTISSITDLAVAVASVLDKTFVEGSVTPIGLQDFGTRHFIFPPLIAFVDDVQALPKSVERGLVQAVDGSFRTPEGDVFDTQHVCWIVATTDRDLLVDPLNKFTVLNLKPLTAEQIAQVVRLHNPDWPKDVCQLAAQHTDSLRDALAFAKEMRAEFEMNGGDLKNIAEIVAKDWTDQPTPWLNRLRHHRN